MLRHLSMWHPEDCHWGFFFSLCDGVHNRFMTHSPDGVMRYGVMRSSIIYIFSDILTVVRFSLSSWGAGAVAGTSPLPCLAAFHASTTCFLHVLSFLQSHSQKLPCFASSGRGKKRPLLLPVVLAFSSLLDKLDPLLKRQQACIASFHSAYLQDFRQLAQNTILAPSKLALHLATLHFDFAAFFDLSYFWDHLSFPYSKPWCTSWVLIPIQGQILFLL